MKKFLRSVWGIVCMVGLGLVVLAGAAVGGNYLWYNAQPKFQDITVELGTQQIELSQFFTRYAKAEKAAFVTELTEENLSKAGDIPVILRQGKKEETVTLHIVDTTAPVVEFLAHRSEPSGYEPKPEDFVVNVSDFSETTFSFAQLPEIPTDYRDVELTVVVTDAHGNKTEQSCILSYIWLKESLQLELGESLTSEHLLFAPEKDADFLDIAQLDAVNAGGVGEYTVTSTIGEQTLQCMITVADTTAPTLELKDVSIYPGNRFKAKDFVTTAEDVSGDVELTLLTEPDTTKVGKYTVQIEAKDIYGNTVVQEATLQVVKDKTPPVIKGVGTMTVEKNSDPNYLKGVTARDTKDGNCEVTVSVENVDLSKAGTYYAIYSAEDSSGNKATAKRKIIVSPDSEDTAALVAQIAKSVGNDYLALRTYVRNKVKYTHNWGGNDPVWFGFTNKHGNCYVHALCLKALLDYYGYQTELIWVTNQDDPHYWLIINVGGQWYHIDATPGPYHAKYDQLMTNEMRLATLRGRVWDTSKWPQLND